MADDQICALEIVFADGPRLIGAVDALGRVARGESGPRCDKQKTAGSSERHHDVFHCNLRPARQQEGRSPPRHRRWL